MQLLVYLTIKDKKNNPINRDVSFKLCDGIALKPTTMTSEL